MKVLIINPPNSPFSERSILIEPIDVLGIATYAKHLGNSVRFLDMDVKQQKPESIEETLSAFHPNIVIIPFDYHVPLHTTEAIHGVNTIGKIAKEYGSKVIVGGKTPKHYPAAFLGNADIVINGEMEPVLHELLNNVSLSQIGGISYMENGNIISTSKRKQHINIDSLPIPDRSFVDLKDYIDIRAVLTSKGCTKRCRFCATPDFWGTWRARSPKNVADEIEMLVSEYGAEKIILLDDNATAKKERIRGICREIISRGIETKLGCLGTISSYDRETIHLMQKAGFRWIHYGAESGSKKVLDAQGKGITPELIRKAVVETRQAGLRVRTSWIFDLPETDETALSETIELILEIGSDEIRAHYMVPRAGTQYSKDSSSIVPSQYIHIPKPILGLSKMPPNKIVQKVEALAEELETRGYAVIKSAEQWCDIESLKKKSPELKFISFCPSRYGLGW